MTFRSTAPLALLFGILASVAASTSCEKKPTKPPESSDQLAVVTTTGMVADLVRSIGGEHVQVRNLIGEGIDPHLYKPTRDDIAELLNADIVFYNGLLLEGKMAQVLEKTAATKPVIAIAEQIPAELLIYPEDSGDHPDPHVWLDPELWAQCSNPVVEALTQAQPKNAEHFLDNQTTFVAKAASLADYGRQSIGSIPPNVRLLITSHDAFNYFGRAFDIEVLGVQGITTESEAGLAEIEQLVAILVERKIPAVFVESSVPARSVEALVEGANAQGVEVVIGGELFTDAMGPSGTFQGTWPGMIDHDVTTVTRALGGSAPTGGMSGMLTEEVLEAAPQ